MMNENKVGLLVQRIKRTLHCRGWKLIEKVRPNFIGEVIGARFLFLHGERISELFYCKFFEENELLFLREYLKDGDRVIDVGANIGIYSVISARCVGNSGMVIALEPNSAVLARLSRNIFLNALENVVVLSLGASDGMNIHRLYSSPNSDPALGSLVEGLHVSGNGYYVPLIKIDDIWMNYFKSMPVSFLKIDVEGWEKNVLCGASKLLVAENKPLVQIELNRTALKRAGTEVGEIGGILCRSGYELYRYRLSVNGDPERYVDIGEESVNVAAVPTWARERFNSAMQNALVKHASI